MRNFDLVLFDMDGLMFDTERLARRGWQHAGEQVGFPVGIDVLTKVTGRNAADVRRLILEAVGADFPYEQARSFVDRYIVEYVAEHGTPLMPGLVELMDYLDKRQIHRGVATSTEESRAKKLLHHGGMLDRVDRIVYGDMVPRGKPNPDIFLKAAELFGCPAEKCLVLEDSPAGVEAAWRAGMSVVMVVDLIEPDEVTASRYTHRAESLHQVISYLEA